MFKGVESQKLPGEWTVSVHGFLTPNALVDKVREVGAPKAKETRGLEFALRFLFLGKYAQGWKPTYVEPGSGKDLLVKDARPESEIRYRDCFRLKSRYEEILQVPKPSIAMKAFASKYHVAANWYLITMTKEDGPQFDMAKCIGQPHEKNKTKSYARDDAFWFMYRSIIRMGLVEPFKFKKDVGGKKVVIPEITPVALSEEWHVPKALRNKTNGTLNATLGMLNATLGLGAGNDKTAMAMAKHTTQKNLKKEMVEGKHPSPPGSVKNETKAKPVWSPDAVKASNPHDRGQASLLQKTFGARKRNNKLKLSRQKQKQLLRSKPPCKTKNHPCHWNETTGGWATGQGPPVALINPASVGGLGPKTVPCDDPPKNVYVGGGEGVSHHFYRGTYTGASSSSSATSSSSAAASAASSASAFDEEAAFEVELLETTQQRGGGRARARRRDGAGARREGASGEERGESSRKAGAGREGDESGFLSLEPEYADDPGGAD